MIVQTSVVFPYISFLVKIAFVVTFQLFKVTFCHIQRAKKVVSDNPGLVDFVIGLVISVINLPDGKVMFFEEFK